MITIQNPTNYGCQEISGALCIELSGGSFKKIVEFVGLIVKAVEYIDKTISDFGPSFVQGFKEGWEAAAP
jgi:hypothetical protein